MNIKEFVVGSIITRNEAMVYGHSATVDSSYCGDRIVLLGHDTEAKIIFFNHDLHHISDLSYARDGWDEGWCKYPEEMVEKIKEEIGAAKTK